MRKRPRLSSESRTSEDAVEPPGSERMPGVIGNLASPNGSGHEATDATVGGAYEPVEHALREVVGRDARGNADDDQPARPQHAVEKGSVSASPTT